MTNNEGEVVDETTGDGSTSREQEVDGEWTSSERYAVVFCDGEGTITAATKPFVDWFGAADEDVIGSSLDGYLTDGGDETATTLPQLLGDDRGSRVLRLSTADGNHRCVAFETISGEIGSSAEFVGVTAELGCERITQKRQLLSEVSRSVGEATTYQQGIEHTLQALCIYTEWCYGEVWTPAADGDLLEYTFGYTNDPAVESFLAESRSITFAFGEGLPGRVYSSASTEWIPDASREPETVFHRARLAAEVGLRAAFGVPITADGEVVAVLVFFLYERRERDDDLASDVCDVVSRLGGPIQRTRSAELTRQRNERLEAFAEVVSHDLRNPLNVAAGALSMVGEECDSEYIETIESAHDRMGELITDVLTLARQGKTVDNPESVALADAVTDCWETVDTAAATLAVDVDTEIVADRSRLRQLIENLLRNAIDHGGPAVTVTVGPLPSGFYIEDDGTGIGDVDTETVFELGTTTAADGTGLGLAIVREVAEAHGWEIEAVDGESGARFEVTGVEEP